MNICLVRCPSPFLIDDRVFPPLGLMSVGAGLKQDGHTVTLYDRGIDKIPEGFDGYGFGPTTPEYMSSVKAIHELREREPNAKYVLGGVHAKLHGLQCLKDGWDTIVMGDGEYAASHAFTGEDPLVIGEPDCLDDYPFPDRTLVDLYSYHFDIHGRHATSLMTSRGCPFHCGFCCKTEDTVRIRSAASVVREIQEIEAIGFSAIIFPEDLFIVNRRRVEDVCEYLSGRDILWRCMVRGDLIVKYGVSFLKTITDAGCMGVGIGAESGSNRILKIINKGENAETIREAIHMMKDAGIHVKGFFILGLPGENEESLQETAAFLEDVQLDDIDCKIFQPYEGSPIWNNRHQYDISWNGQPTEYAFFKGRPGEYHGTVSTSQLTNARLVEIWKQMEAKYKKWKQPIGGRITCPICD